MAIGLGVLGYDPKTFWSLTPSELDAALIGRFGARAFGAALTQSDLGRLMQQFPDKSEMT